MNVKILAGGFSMKKAIHAFLKVSFILSIILLAVGVIYIPLAILAIIVGAICTEFALAAGILMLTLPEERYKEE